SRNVLIFHRGALGDFILTWPLALALGRIHPQSRIIYITPGEKGALAEKVLGVESMELESGWHHLYGDIAKLPAPATRLMAGAHSIYSFLARDGDDWSAGVRRIAPQAVVRCLEPIPPADFGQHWSEFLVLQLADRQVVAEALRQMVRSIAHRGLGRGAVG